MARVKGTQGVQVAAMNTNFIGPSYSQASLKVVSGLEAGKSFEAYLQHRTRDRSAHRSTLLWVHAMVSRTMLV